MLYQDHQSMINYGTDRVKDGRDSNMETHYIYIDVYSQRNQSKLHITEGNLNMLLIITHHVILMLYLTHQNNWNILRQGMKN